MDKWTKYFQTYRIIETRNDEDLLYQVGTTTNSRPISRIQHKAMVDSIITALELNPNDNLLDLCCGNGVITFDLSSYSNMIIGIDSSFPYIQNAINKKKVDNIEYYCSDILDMVKYIEEKKINKVLFYAALAYFTRREISTILLQLKQLNVEKIFIGGILDKDRKLNFFRSRVKVLLYLFHSYILRKDPGLGNWWTTIEIISIARKAGYEAFVLTQPDILHTAHYRFDILLINNDYYG